jgi:hypothetical protein
MITSSASVLAIFPVRIECELDGGVDEQSIHNVVLVKLVASKFDSNRTVNPSSSLFSALLVTSESAVPKETVNGLVAGAPGAAAPNGDGAAAVDKAGAAPKGDGAAVASAAKVLAGVGDAAGAAEATPPKGDAADAAPVVAVEAAGAGEPKTAGAVPKLTANGVAVAAWLMCRKARRKD